MTLGRGVRLGPYEITGALGAGGMGEVYRARDTRLDRDVAVKVLPASFAMDEERLRRFAREARAAGALNHPNILAVFDIGTQEGGAPYLVSELLTGETLRERLSSGRLPISKTIDLARQIAAGLAAVHEKGIAHRDIKPENLFVTTDGRVKVLDFGLARQNKSSDETRAEDQALTHAGTVMGTVSYMAPEQVRGLPGDERSDIFSFGAVLYEMATGTRAFSRASPVETMSAILNEDPAEVPASIREMYPALAWIIARCLEKSPAERFHSAHDLGLALQSISSTSASARTVAETRRRVRTPDAVLWVLIVALAAAVGAILHQRLAGSAAVDPPTIEPLTFSGHDASPAASPDGKTVAFMSDRDGVARIWLKQAAGGGELVLTAGPDDYPRFSPDGSSILFVRTTADGSSLYRVPLLGGDPRRLLDDVTGADWSPDGRQLAFTRWVSGARSGSVVGIADANGTGARELAYLPGRSLVTPRWSPDGRTIAAVNGLAHVLTGFGIDFVDAADGKARRLPPAHGTMRQSSVVWSADSRSVIYSEAESLAAWLTGSSARIMQQNVVTGTARSLVWVPNHSRTLDVLGPGQLLLDARSSRENLREVAIGSPETPGGLTRGNSTDRQPTYSPDGQWVAFSSNRGGNLDLWSVNRENGTVRRLTDDPADDWDVAYSPDGRRLLWGSNRSGPYEIWTANPDGSAPRQLSHDGAFAQNPTETRDGKWIIYASTNLAHPGLWRMRADGSEPVRIVEASALQLPDLSPDGQWALYVDGLSSRILVVTIPDGNPVPFAIHIVRRTYTPTVLGRAHWMPNGRAIAFIGQDDRGVTGVFAQDFVPGRDTIATRRILGGFDPDNATESFAISPDGTKMTIAGWEQMFTIMIANGVPGVERAARAKSP